MFSMGLTLTTQDFKILAQRPFYICVGAIAQYLIMPFLAFGISKALNLSDGIALGPVSYTHLDVYKRQELGSANKIGTVDSKATVEDAVTAD